MPEGAAKLRIQEMELAQLQQKAKEIKRLMLELRRQAEEAVASVARATAHAQQATEAARQEEAKQAIIREEAARAYALAAEAAKLAAA